MDVFEIMKFKLSGRFDLFEMRPNNVQVVTPLFHEDGDMLDIFIDLPKNPGAPLRISDHGCTLMHLSYSFELDTPSRKKMLARILSENGVEDQEGDLSIKTTPETLYADLVQFAQVVAKVSTMRVLEREGEQGPVLAECS